MLIANSEIGTYRQNWPNESGKMGMPYLQVVWVILIVFLWGCKNEPKSIENENPNKWDQELGEQSANGKEEDLPSTHLNQIPDFLPSYPSFGLAEGYSFKQTLDNQGRVVQFVMTEQEGKKRFQFEMQWDGHQLKRQILVDSYEEIVQRDTIEFVWKGNIGKGMKPGQEEIEIDESGRVVRRIVGVEFPTAILLNTYDPKGGLKQQIRCYRDGLNMIVRYARFAKQPNDGGEGNRKMMFVDTEIDGEEFDETWPEKGVGIFQFPSDFESRAKNMSN